MGIETLTMGALIGSAGIGALGSIQQGFAQQQQAEYNAGVAEANATAARQQAALDESTSRRRSSLVLGTIRARAAANSGDVGGSALDVLSQSAGEAELEALTLRYAGEVRARQSESEAALYRTRGRSAVIGGFVGAGEALLRAGAYGLHGGGAGGGAGDSAIPPLAATVPPRNSWGGRLGPV